LQGASHVVGDKIGGYLYGHSTNGLARDPESFQKIYGNDEPLPKIVNIMPHFRKISDNRFYCFERMIPDDAYSDIPNEIIPQNLAGDHFRNTRFNEFFKHYFEKRSLTKFWKNSGGAEGQPIFPKPRPDDAMRREARAEYERPLGLAI